MSDEHGNIIAHARATLAAARYRTDIRAGHHDLIADEPASAGGADAGASPFGLVLAGLGACTAITLRMYAERKGWELKSLTVAMTCYREDKVIKIDRTIAIEGVDPDQRTRMAEIAEKTPVTLALKAGMPIATTVA
jgi:putative redox protein